VRSRLDCETTLCDSVLVWNVPVEKQRRCVLFQEMTPRLPSVLLLSYLTFLVAATAFSFSTCRADRTRNDQARHVIDTMSITASKAASRLFVGKLQPESTALLLCDMQERFRPLIHNMETVVNTCRYMTSVGKALNVPVLATQQYTKVFGETVPDCFADPQDLQTIPNFDKKKFSMLTEDVDRVLDEWKKDTYIIMGIEAHVCVQQTCLDLLERGANVHVIADAVSSQQAYDREIALQRLQAAGCFLTTAQSAAFMLLQSADHSNFKAVSKLTVEHMKLPNEFNLALTK
jgi:nicotinamidase-related amidase